MSRHQPSMSGRSRQRALSSRPVGMDSSAPAGRAALEPEAGMLALEELASPDPESRSEAWEGRRLVRVNGGFVVLNFMSYRDKDNTGAERAKRYRERQKLIDAGAISLPNRDEKATRHAVTQRDASLAEAEAEA